MAWLHTGLGLFTGWILFAIALSGTLTVFREDISVWMRPEAPPIRVAPVEALSDAVNWLSKHAPRSPAWYLTAPNEREPFTLATYAGPSGAFVQKALDPRTGSPDSLRDTYGGEFFYRFHFELQLPYPFGRLIAAVAALALVIGLLTGVIIHRRIFSDFFMFRPAKGQRSWMDAHNLLGVLALPFHLMISFTGAVTLVTLLLPWAGMAVYKHDPAAEFRDLSPALISRPPSGKTGHLVPVTPLLMEATRRFGNAGIAQVYFFNPTDSASTVTVIAGNTGTIRTLTHSLSFDGTTGQIIKEHIETRPLIQAYTFLYGLHIAHFAPRLTRWLYFISGLMLSGVIGTGMHLWTVKRARKIPCMSSVLVERMNVGVLGGTPLAFASYFLVNRILPLNLQDRADHEVQCVFVIWVAALIFSLFRPASSSWPPILTANAVACISITALSAPWNTAVLGGSGGVSIFLSLAFVYAHRVAQRTYAS